jgi:hypothetical protein
MRGILKVCLFWGISGIASHLAQAQIIIQRSELGGGIGVFNYTGDLIRNYHLGTSRPAVTFFYKSNLSKVISSRVTLTGGKLAASDRTQPIDAFGRVRDASFNIFLLEGSYGYEYHFLDWRSDNRRMRFTPYVFAGVALFGISGFENKNAEFSNVQMAIPFGGGMKYVLSPKYYVSFEFGIRKTFFDYLDNISDEDPGFKNYQYGNAFDNDNYYFMGFSLTYTFYQIPCPTSPYR